MDKNAAEVLKQIADKLDIPVQTLWAGLVAYAPFTYYQWIVGLSIGLFLALLCFGAFAYFVHKNPHNDGTGFPLILGICVLLATGVYCVGELPNAMAAKMAPEAWAAQQIIQKVSRR